MGRPPKTIDLHCMLTQETEQAICVDIDDVENDRDMNIVQYGIWIPKSCLCEDDFDCDGELQQLREASTEDELFPLGVQLWWLRQQDWFTEIMGSVKKGTEQYRERVREICVRMLQLRDWADLSLAELSKEMGIADKTICNYENFATHPPLWAILRYCEVFECNVEWLMCGTGEKFK